MPNQRKALERTLKDVQSRLRNHPGSIELMFERARLFDRLGRVDDARLAYVEILERDASHFGALNDLGMLLFKAGLRQDAFTCFNAAVAKHPRQPIGHANLALVLLRGGEAQKAREHYEVALQLDPRNAEAHRGLALALAALGDEASAVRHRDAGFGLAPIVELPYRGEGSPIRALLLVSAGPGNVPLDRFLDDRIFAVSKLVTEYYLPSLTLPAHDVIVNAIGDADASAGALVRAAEVCARSNAPAINSPAAVRQTERAENAERLTGIDGVVAPTSLRLPREFFSTPEAVDELASRGIGLPFLLRAPGFHTGMHFERVESRERLATAVARLPGKELLAVEYVDVRGSDGNARKYRVMFIGGELYPLHLAISPNWKVHYFSAGMADYPERRIEEESFLRDPSAVLGPRAKAALDGIAKTLELDYAGVDFALNASGNVVAFEANATMIVPVADPDERFAYRREPIARIEEAVRRLLAQRAGEARRLRSV